jgi:hypothetical protein
MPIFDGVEVFYLAALHHLIFAGFQFFMSPMRFAHDNNTRDPAMMAGIYNPCIIAVNS